MRALQELINNEDPAFPLIRAWAAEAVRPVEILPPSAAREDALLRTQVTTRSPMGAIVYETGGILIDHGWLRALGGGHERLTRTLPDWNEGRSDGFFLVADDAVGGFFAINGGSLGADIKNMYYFAPDSLEWEAMDVGYSGFLEWACTGDLASFYEWIRWPDWATDVISLHGDRCYSFYPPLFTQEGQGGSGTRVDIPAAETWDLQMEFRKQLESCVQG